MAKDYNIVFLFSGQGSHYRNMGSELFFTDDSFRPVMEFAEDMVQRNTGRSLIRELYEVKGKFDDLLITHPAILAIEFAMLKVMETMNIQPDLVVGNSLGEFAAGVAAGVWNVEEAMLSCIKRAIAITENVSRGGMIAVLSERTSELTATLDYFGLYVASDNFKGHFTASGLMENINGFTQHLERQKISYQLLEVAYPFHSPYMDKVKCHYPNDMPVSLLNRPVKTKMYSPLQGKEIVTAVEPDYFGHAVSKPFNFGAMILQLEKDYGPCIYIDLGPSGTMATFVKYNLPEKSSSVPIMLLSPFKGVEQRLRGLWKRIESQKSM